MHFSSSIIECSSSSSEDIIKTGSGDGSIIGEEVGDEFSGSFFMIFLNLNGLKGGLGDGCKVFIPFDVVAISSS